MSQTSRNVRWSARVLAAVLFCTLVHPAVAPARTEGPQALLWAQEGGNLSADGAAQLEAALAAEPEDLPTRVKLLGYYSRSGSESTRSVLAEHALWIIRNQPGSDAAGLDEVGRLASSLDVSSVRLREAWLDQLEAAGDDPRILENAASFFSRSDRDLARDLLKKGHELEPTNPEWSQRLGQFYSLAMMRADGESKSVLAKQALSHLEDALLGVDALHHSYQLPKVAQIAFEAGEVEKARSYATELLGAPEGHWNYGNAIHQGHLILGRIALREGFLEQAKDHLLQAGETPGSPQLNSFGPSMRLAKELLEHGETASVLEYFKLCGKFWESSRGRLEGWARIAEQGQVPDFGANLSY